MRTGCWTTLAVAALLAPAGGSASTTAAGSAAAAPQAPGTREAPAAGEARPGPAAPAFRLPAGVRPTSVDLELEVDPAADGFRGEVAIAVDLGAAAGVVWLHALDLEVDAAWVEAGGERIAATAERSGDFLALRPERPVGPGKAWLGVRFAGRYELTDTRGLFKQVEGKDAYVYSQLEATDARRAFPAFDEPSYKVPWRLRLVVPEGVTALANTRATGEEPAGEGRKRVTFAETRPLPSYLVAIAVGPFETIPLGTMGKGDTPVRIVVPRGMAGQAAWPAAIARPIFERVEAYFGMPYPYDKLDHVAIPQTVGFGAMENPGLVTYSASGLLSRPEDRSESSRRRLADTMAHEVAHIWFGDLVTLAWWDDLWLNEAFATWLARKVVADWQPGWEVDVTAVRSRGWATGSDSLASARAVRQPIAGKDDIENAFDGITYAKGAALLAMFEAWLGEEPFRDGVRRYVTAHAHGNATTADFLAALSGGQAGPVPAAFATFLDQPGLPLVTMELACPDDGPPRLALEQRRFLPRGSPAAARDALWHVPVCVRWSAGGTPGRACTLLRERTGTLPLAGAAGCPERVAGNEGARGYYRVGYRGGLLAPLLEGGGAWLTLPERVTLLGDVSALVSAGELPYPAVLDALPDFARDPSRHVAASAAAIASGLDEHLVTDELRPAYARFVRALFGERARELGLVPAADEEDDVRLLRATLVGLAGDEGEDRELRAAAVKLARGWLDDRSAVDADLVGTVLGLAVIDGDRGLHERILAEARKATDRRDRRRLLGALGGFRDPALVRASLGLVLDDAFDVRETRGLLSAAFAEPAGQAVAWAFLRENWDAIVARLPEESAAGLPRVATAFCDAERRAEAEAFFRERVAGLTGAPRVLAQALERVDQCIAMRAAEQPAVARFLERW